MDNVLIDTDVLLDFFLNRHPFAEFSTQLVALCELGEIRGFVTPVIVSNLYSLLRRNSKHRKVISELTKFLSMVDVLSMNKTVVMTALQSGFNDFEDSLQYSAALKSGNIGVIVTRNIKDYKKSEIGVMTPETFVRLHAAS